MDHGLQAPRYNPSRNQPDWRGGRKPPRNPQVFNGTDPKAERTSCAAVWGSMQQPAHSCAGRKHVDIQNAFINKTLQPTAEEVSAALGATAGVWKQLVDWLAVEKGVADQDGDRESTRLNSSHFG